MNRSFAFSVAQVVLAVNLLLVESSAQHWPGAIWTKITPDQANMDAAKLNSKPSGDIALFRGGYLVYESGSTTTPRAQYSACKSMTSMICARLNQMGKLGFDDQVPLSNNAAKAGSDWGISAFNCGVNSSTKSLATFRHFMNMKSDFGLSGYSPGAHGAYNNNAVHFYGTYMNRTWFGNVSAANFLKSALLNHTGSEHNISFNGQYGGWDGGWSISLRDAGRLGLLMLRKGQWNGAQIIPSSYVSACFTSQNGGVPLNSSKPCNDDKWNQGFGLGSYAHAWWVYDGNATYASGYGGHYICVIRDQDIVVTTHGGSGGGNFIKWARGAVKGPFKYTGGSTSNKPPSVPIASLSIDGMAVIYNLQGKEMQRISGLVPGSYSIDVSTLQPGTYLLRSGVTGSNKPSRKSGCHLFNNAAGDPKKAF